MDRCGWFLLGGKISILILYLGWHKVLLSVLYLINGVLTWPGEEFQGLTKVVVPCLGGALAQRSLEVSRTRLDVAFGAT